MFNTDPDTDIGGLTPRKRFAAPALPMPVMDADPSSNPLRGIEQPQPDGPPNPFEKALAMGTALGNTLPPDAGVAPAKPKLGAPPAATDTPAPKLGAAPAASPDGSAAVAQPAPKLGAASSNAQEIPGITRKPFFSSAERGIKNPVLRTLAEIGDVAGSSMFPGITNNIPGTRGAEHIAENRELAQDKERADTGYKNAQTEALQAKPEKEENPEADAYAVLSDPNSTPEQKKAAQDALETVKGAGKTDKAIADPKAGYAQAIAEAIKNGRDPNTDPHVQAWKAAIDNIAKQEKAPNTKEGLQQKILAASEAGNTAEVKRLQGELKAIGDPYAQTKIEISQQGATDRHDAADQKKKDAITKQAKQLQQTLDEAESAHNLQKMAEAGNAAADVDLALSFFKTMRGNGGAGIRFTQQEQSLIMGARNSAGDLQAMAQKVIGGGQKFTPEQRKQIVDVIDMHAKAAKSAMERMQGGGTAPAPPAGAKVRDYSSLGSGGK